MKSNLEQARLLAKDLPTDAAQKELLARVIYQNHLLESKLNTILNSMMYYNVIITLLMLASIYLAGVASGSIV